MSTDANTVADFVRARLDEWEQTARAATPGPWTAETHHRNITPAQARRQFTLHDTPRRVGRIEVGAEVHPVAEEEGNGDGGVLTGADADHIAAHDPATVLRQVAAMRAVVDLHTGGTKYVYADDGTPACGTCGDHTVRWPCPTIRHLAAIWQDHPDYRDEWKP